MARQNILPLALAIACLPLPAAAQSDPVADTIQTWRAEEARQGVAVDADYFYAVTNARMGKYRRDDGSRVAEWAFQRDGIEEGTGIVHLNSCAVIESELVCAHSNFPSLPMASSVEIFDPDTLSHLRSVPLGLRAGSLTWIDRHDGKWWAGFANYDGRGGEAGRDHRYTRIVMLDDNWQELAAYALPAGLLGKLAPHSTSGGAWGADGLLYVTGHDAAEMYQLRIPSSGSVLEWVGTLSVPIEGQAWAFDRSSPDTASTVFGIRRSTGEVVSFRLPMTTP